MSIRWTTPHERIPTWLRKHPQVTDSAIRLWLALYALCYRARKETISVSSEAIAAEAGRGRQWVPSRLRELELAGAVEVTRSAGQFHTITLLPEGVGDQRQGVSAIRDTATQPVAKSRHPVSPSDDTPLSAIGDTPAGGRGGVFSEPSSERSSEESGTEEDARERAAENRADKAKSARDAMVAARDFVADRMSELPAHDDWWPSFQAFAAIYPAALHGNRPAKCHAIWRDRMTPAEREAAAAAVRKLREIVDAAPAPRRQFFPRMETWLGERGWLTPVEALELTAQDTPRNGNGNHKPKRAPVGAEYRRSDSDYE